MKETLISGKILLSLKCCMLHTSRRLGYIVLAIEGQVVVVRMEGDNIVQIFSGPDAKPMKNIRAEITWPTRKTVSSSVSWS